MKRLLAVGTTLCMLLSSFCFASAFDASSEESLEELNSAEIDDYMTADIEPRYGDVPSYGDLWDLSTSGQYVGHFNFSNYTYSNYNFTGVSSIKVATNASTTDSEMTTLSTFDTNLYKRTLLGSSKVGSFKSKRDGSSSSSFSVNKSDRYFVYLEKARDGCYTSGSLTVS